MRTRTALVEYIVESTSSNYYWVSLFRSSNSNTKCRLPIADNLLKVHSRYLFTLKIRPNRLQPKRAAFTLSYLTAHLSQIDAHKMAVMDRKCRTRWRYCCLADLVSYKSASHVTHVESTSRANLIPPEHDNVTQTQPSQNASWFRTLIRTLRITAPVSTLR